MLLNGCHPGVSLNPLGHCKWGGKDLHLCDWETMHGINRVSVQVTWVNGPLL